MEIQFSSVAQSCPTLATPWTIAHQTFLSITNSQSLLKLRSIELVRPSNHLIFWHPLLRPPSIFSSIRVFSNESVSHLSQWVSGHHQVAKVLELQLQSFQWIFRVYFRIDWFDLFAGQGTLKSLLQHHNSKASIHCCSAFFLVQLSHQCMTIGKTIALTIQNFVGKVMSLLFNSLAVEA